MQDREHVLSHTVDPRVFVHPSALLMFRASIAPASLMSSPRQAGVLHFMAGFT
jgi:hypothetical protein